MIPDEKVRCPATGFERTCKSVVFECTCPKFVNVKGKDPQTGAVVDQWGCVDAFLPMLLVEVAQQSRQTGAAIESFRNEIVAAERQKQEILSEFAGNRGIRLVPSK